MKESSAAECLISLSIFSSELPPTSQPDKKIVLPSINDLLKSIDKTIDPQISLNKPSFTPKNSAFKHISIYKSLVAASTENVATTPRKKLDTLRNGSTVARQCGDCRSEKTSGHWCQDNLVVGGYVCQKCYRRRRRNIRIQTVIRSCYDCSSKETKVWFRHASIPHEYICLDCEHKSDNTGSKCGGCGLWRDCGSNDLHLCKKCYKTYSKAQAPFKPGHSSQSSISSISSQASE